MRTCKLFFRKIFVALGLISSFITVSWMIFPIQLNLMVNGYEWYFLIGVLFLIISYGIISIFPKNKIKLKLGENLTVDITYGDIFEKDGIIVIPVNDYFDTLVNDKVVSKDTIHGIFIKRLFPDNDKQLKRKITASLRNITPAETNKARKQGNKSRYPLGTVANIPHNGKNYYLVALTRFNNNHRAELKKSEYQRVLCDLFDYIEQNSQGERVNVPLIGAGRAGLDVPKQKLLEFMLLSLTLNDKLTLIHGLEFVLHECVKQEINLNIIENYYEILEA